jgi:hypothetical protein
MEPYCYPLTQHLALPKKKNNRCEKFLKYSSPEEKLFLLMPSCKTGTAAVFIAAHSNNRKEKINSIIEIYNE